MKTMRSFRAVLPLVLLCACSTQPSDDDDSSPGDDDDSAVGDDDDDVLPDPGSLQLDGLCPLATRYGGFFVEANPQYSVVQGQVSDGVVPATVLEPLQTDTQCALLRRNNPFCDPACEPGFTCDFDGTCVAYPVPQDVGVVTVRGLVEDVSMTPVQPGNNYFFTGLPVDSMRVGETVRLRAAGAAWPGFDLFGVGVAALDLGGAEEWTIEQGVDLVVTWVPAPSSARAEIAFRVNIDQHGLSPATLFCTFEDDGEGTVPQAMIDGLFAAGVSGWPNASLVRRTADSEDAGGGCVEFVVTSPRTASVDVVGYTPCDAQHPCPDGLDCNPETELCE